MHDVEMDTWLLVPILAPLATAVVAFMLAESWRAWLALLATTLSLIANGFITTALMEQGPLHYPLGDWAAPLGIELYADGLSCAMLWLTSIVSFFSSIYAQAYRSHLNRRDSAESSNNHVASEPFQSFWPLWLLMQSSLAALLLSRDIFNLYVTLELMSLAAIGLVVVANSRDSIGAALRYLIVALVGSLLYLAGVGLLYGEYGTLDLAGLGHIVRPTATTSAAVLLIMLGLMIKTALFPFHFWLPPAHGSAPPPVSAVLSGLVVKGSFYMLLRLWFEVFPAEVVAAIAAVPTVLGAAAIVWGSLQALFAERLKQLVAYSTVAQVGYLFLVFSLAPAGSPLAEPSCNAAVLFALSHGLAKASLFLAAGTVLLAAGHDRIADLATVAHRLPVTFFAIGIASISLMGLPPSASFLAKWTWLEAAFDRGQSWLAAPLIGGGLLAAAYMFRVLAQAFTEPNRSMNSVITQPPMRMEWTALALAAAGLALGIGADLISELVGAASPWIENSQSGAAI